MVYYWSFNRHYCMDVQMDCLYGRSEIPKRAGSIAIPCLGVQTVCWVLSVLGIMCLCLYRNYIPSPFKTLELEEN